MAEKNRRFVLRKFVKTCRELDNSLENEDGGDDYELEAGEEGSMIVQDVKDNSAFVFKEHTSE